MTILTLTKRNRCQQWPIRPCGSTSPSPSLLQPVRSQTFWDSFQQEEFEVIKQHLNNSVPDNEWLALFPPLLHLIVVHHLLLLILLLLLLDLPVPLNHHCLSLSLFFLLFLVLVIAALRPSVPSLVVIQSGTISIFSSNWYCQTAQVLLLSYLA